MKQIKLKGRPAYPGKAVGEAIVKGADFRLNPQNGTTRAEACAMLHRFFR